MNLLTQLAHVDNEVLKQVLAVLDRGIGQLHQEVTDFTDLLDPDRTPPQYLPHLAATLGLDTVTGLSESDTRALLAALGAAYYHKGGMHGLRLVVRALWRYATITESFRAIYQEAVLDPDGPESVADWPAWMAAKGYDVADLLEVVITAELEVDDAREYGEKQAVEYQSLLDSVRRDSGFDRLLRTYRPGFTTQASTLLGRSQFDENGLNPGAFLLYGRSVAFLDPSSQAIMDALRWNIYPRFKAEVSQGILKHFIPLGAHVTYRSSGYRQDDVITLIAEDEFRIET